MYGVCCNALVSVSVCHGDYSTRINCCHSHSEHRHASATEFRLKEHHAYRQQRVMQLCVAGLVELRFFAPHTVG